MLPKLTFNYFRVIKNLDANENKPDTPDQR
jgi:hypothetical protein